MEWLDFGGTPMNLEFRLSVEDSLNSVRVVIETLRYVQVALDRGLSGPLEAPSAYLMKRPPCHMRDDEARLALQEFFEAVMTGAAAETGQAPPRADVSALRVMSFNLGGFVSNRPEPFDWSHRAPLVSELLLAHQPHIVAMQEVQPGNMPALGGALRGYEAFGGRATYALPPSEEATYNIVFWQRDCFRCVDSDSIYLSETPDEWSLSWGASSVRGATWTCLEFRESTRRLIACCAHLDHRSKDARDGASRLLIARLDTIAQAHDASVVIAGDFNSRASAPPNETLGTYPSPVLPTYLPEGGLIHAIYTAAGYRDAFLEAGAHPGLETNTYHDFLGEDFPHVALRIDWILYKDRLGTLSTRDFTVVKEPRSGSTFPSDHYPIIAHLACCA